MTFYEKLNHLCMRNGISITAVAVELGYSRSITTTWKNSKGMPRPNTIKKISDYFGVPVSYFYDNEEIKNAPEIKSDARENEEYTLFNEQEKTIIRIFRETTESGRMRIIQAVMNISDEEKIAILRGKDSGSAAV